MSNNPNWKASLQAIINRNIHQHREHDMELVQPAKAACASTLFELFKLLRDLGFQLDPKRLDGNHVKHLFWYCTCDPRIEALCRRRGVPMRTEPYSAAYLHFLTSTLCTFSEWIGKPGLVLPPERYGIDPARFARSDHAPADPALRSTL